MPDLITRPIPGYELLDSGSGRKLERIAGILVDRPSPPAIWRRRLGADRWAAATSRVERTKDGGGFWQHRGREPAGLTLDWTPAAERRLRFALRLTAFGHCGLFFEQEPVWRLMHGAVSRLGRPAKGLNLFGYTGAASLAMAAGGAEVFHVDSAKGVLTWGKESEAASTLGAGRMRWVHEDALAFLAHSQKRGFRYDAILADPPSWGHGAGKEVWQFDEHIQALADACASVLSDDGVLLLSAHTPGVQHQALANVLGAGGLSSVISGEFAQTHQTDARLLPAGVWALGMRTGDPAALLG
jgi:23S rRNA (cytosine1962-C5)-methyltransferase